MKFDSCLLVGLDAQSAAIAQTAAHDLFTKICVTPVSTMTEIFSRPESRCSVVGILIIGQATDAELQRAVNTTDHHGLPKWAIIAVGTFTQRENLQSIFPEDWTAKSARRELRLAVQFLELTRDNARLRGDLLTLGHRISHDLRTPLGGIISSGEVIKEVLADNNPADTVLTRPLFGSVDDLSKLISRVSFLLKVSAQLPQKQTFAMSEVVWATLQRMERQLLERRMEVTQPENWPEVTGVAACLETVWGNFLSNAIQHGRAGTTVELGWQQIEGNYRFWVRNEGEPVPLEQRAALFHPFHLLHQPNAGRGLGLSIVQRLVELHGGSCRYEVDSTGASVFSFNMCKG